MKRVSRRDENHFISSADTFRVAVHDVDFLRRLTAHQLDEFVGLLLALRGYKDLRYVPSPEGNVAIEVLADDPISGEVWIYIEARQDANNGRRADLASVKRFHNVVRQQRHHLGVLITTTDFTDSARAYAKTEAPNLRLMTPTELMAWVVEAGEVFDGRVQGVADQIRTLSVEHLLGSAHWNAIGRLPSNDQLLATLALSSAVETRIRRVNELPLNALRLIARDPRIMRSLTPRQFEQFIAEIVSDLGFRNVILTPQSRDGGRDVIATKIVHHIPVTFYFECKQYALGRAVQLNTLRSLLGVVAQHGSSANIGVLVTTSHFTRGSMDLIATECRLDGKDYDGITRWVDEWRRMKSLLPHE